MGGCLMLKLADEGVIYARVSSAKQVTEGNGLSSQISACMSYAKENDIKIIKTFQDPARSGKDLVRPGLIDLVDFLGKRKKKTYVIKRALETGDLRNFKTPQVK